MRASYQLLIIADWWCELIGQSAILSGRFVITVTSGNLVYVREEMTDVEVIDIPILRQQLSTAWATSP